MGKTEQSKQICATPFSRRRGMIDHQPVAATAARRSRKVPIQERSVLVGDIVIVNGYGVNRLRLQQRFSEGGYAVQETPHFLLFTREEAPSTILVHWFGPEQLDADMKHYVALELEPLGLLRSSYRYGEILAGIVGSFYPQDIRRAWKYFGANTLLVSPVGFLGKDRDHASEHEHPHR